MAIQTINIGTSANKGDGDPLRVAFDKINKNFAELDVTNTVKDIKGSVFADDSTVLVDSVNGTLNASALSGSLPAIDGSALTGVTATTLAYSSLTGTPTTISGYGITDAYTKTEVDNAITSSVLPSGSAQSIDVVAQDSTVLVDSVNGTLNATTLTGALPAINGSALTNVTTTFANITSTPTTLAGYGITDGLQLGTTATTALAGNTALFSGAFADLTSKPTTIAGYGITDATSTASPAFTGAVDFTGATSVDFTGATISGTSFLTSYTETDPVVGAITGIVKADGAGNISSAVAGTDYLTSVAFSDLTSTPTTIAGYGITDAFDGNYGSLSGTPSTFAPASHTQAFSTITSTPTTLAGYGITDGLALTGLSVTTASAGSAALSYDNSTGAFTFTPPDLSSYLTTVPAQSFASLTGKPTTLAGYGITDALTSGGNITLGGDLDVGGNSIVSASNGPINIAPNGTGDIVMSGQVKFDEGSAEKFTTTNGATGVTALDCSTGHVHYLTAPAGDITANFTNLDLTAEYGTNVTIVIDQGNTQYEVTAVQIGGVAQTIVWQGNSAPTGTANGVDSFSFTILNDGGTYVVLGQMVAFGGV